MYRYFKCTVLIFVVVFLFSGSAYIPAQELLHEINLDDYQGSSDYAFGMKVSPDGSYLFVAISGAYAPNDNERIVMIDTSNDTIAGEQIVGKRPQEIEFKLGDYDEIELIFVSNSNGNSVTVLRPDLSIENTVELPDPGPPFDTRFPSGMAMGPANRYLYVCTVNEGEIYKIDTEPGPDYLCIVDEYSAAMFNTRMTRYNNMLIIPGCDSVHGAVLSILDLNNPSQVETVVLDDNFYMWAPSANDVVVTNWNGLAYVTVSDGDLTGDAALYEVDLNSSPPAKTRTIDLSTVEPYATRLEHGIGGSPNGQNTLVVTNLEVYSSTIKIAGRKAGCALTSLNLDPLNSSQLNEAVFTPDGEKVYVSSQNLPKVYVVVKVPMYGLLLDGTDEVSLGGNIELNMIGGEELCIGLLILSLTKGTLQFPAFNLDLGFPLFVLVNDSFEADNTLPIPVFAVPNDPLISGLEVYFQGLTQDYDMKRRPSNLHVLKIL